MRFKLYLCFSIFITIAVFSVVSNQIDPANDPANIKRPCPNFDLGCIRDYFKLNSKCEINESPVPDPLYFKHYTVEFPNSNVTFELHNLSIQGLNGYVVEFYINTETGTLVLAYRVDSVNLYTPESIIKFNRKCKEPIERSDYMKQEYGSATFTAMFPSISNLDLNDVEIFSYVDRVEPKHTLGPGFSADLDPVTEAQFKKLVASFPPNVQEVFVTHGHIFMVNIIQYNICNFGLQLGNE